MEEENNGTPPDLKMMSRKTKPGSVQYHLWKWRASIVMIFNIILLYTANVKLVFLRFNTVEFHLLSNQFKVCPSNRWHQGINYASWEIYKWKNDLEHSRLNELSFEVCGYSWFATCICNTRTFESTLASTYM